MFDSPETRRRLLYSLSAFLIVWVPGSAMLGYDYGRRLRFGGDDLQHAGPIIDGMLNMGAMMIAPALFAALLVFAVHAWWTEANNR